MEDLYDGRRPTTAVERVVDASPEQLWSLLTDPSMPARFSAEYQGGQWLDDADGPALGARFVGRNRHPVIGEWETISHVVVCDPPTSYAWAVGDPASPNATWRFDVEATDDGTVLRFTVVLGPGRSGLTWAMRQHPDRRDELIARRLDEHRDNMAAVLHGIADLLTTRDL